MTTVCYRSFQVLLLKAKNSNKKIYGQVYGALCLSTLNCCLLVVNLQEFPLSALRGPVSGGQHSALESFSKMVLWGGRGHLEVCRGRGNAVRGKLFVVAFVAGVLPLIVRERGSILQALLTSGGLRQTKAAEPSPGDNPRLMSWFRRA